MLIATMDRTSSSMMFMNLPSSSGSRSISPMTPSPSRELRGARLFRAISRKLGRRSRDDLAYANEEDSRSSSTDSCSSSSAGGGGRSSRSRKSGPDNGTSCSSESSGFRSVSPHRISSSSSSDTGSDTQTVRHRHHRSISTAAFRKVFQSLSINSRSQSCCDTGASSKKKTSKKSAPKRILRPPVTYTYVRGLSGLPTQRIPNPKVYVTQSGCGCSLQYMAALNR